MARVKTNRAPERCRIVLRHMSMLACATLTIGVMLGEFAAARAADDRLPIFDTHIHYSSEAWIAYEPDTVFEKLDAAGVSWALVSSSPDDGTLTLHRKNARRVVPELRPYHGDLHAGNWYRSPEVIPYLEARLKNSIYRGIGEFHLHRADDARTPTMQRVAALALANDIPLHIHSGAGPVSALFAMAPGLKIHWAHAGMVEPAEIVADMLDRYRHLTAEVSFRAHDIAPGGDIDPAWRDLLVRHSDRFMIGTDTYINDRWEVYGSLIEEHRNWLGQLPHDTAKAIAHGNATRIFGLPTPSQ